MNKTALARILKIFRCLDIPFALAGGYAVAAWGAVRATRDIDFLAAVPTDRINELLRELKQAGFKVKHRPGDEDDPVRGVIRLEPAKASDAEPVEIILGIKKMPARIFERARKLAFLGLEVPVVAPEDLIVLKCLAGGPIDLEDARAIFAIMKSKLDLEYLRGEFLRCRISFEKLEKR
jgi:predicted nucleotidyltransferase